MASCEDVLNRLQVIENHNFDWEQEYGIRRMTYSISYNSAFNFDWEQEYGMRKMTHNLLLEQKKTNRILNHLSLKLTGSEVE